MWRRLRWVLLALVVVLAGVVAVVTVVEKPTLDDDERAVDTRWNELRDPLAARYGALDRAVAALDAAGQGERAVTRDLGTDLAAWNDALDGGSPDEQTEAANRLEGQGARLRANILASATLSQDTELVAALAAFDDAAPPLPAVAAYNRAVQTYEDHRSDVRRAVVALILGFDARARFIARA
jgi:hypothetical protein